MSLPYSDGQAIPVHELTNEYDDTYSYNIVYTDGELDKEDDEEVIYDGAGYKKSKNLYLKNSSYVVVVWTCFIKGAKPYITVYMKEPHGLLDELIIKRTFIKGNKIVPTFEPAKKEGPVPTRKIE